MLEGLKIEDFLMGKSLAIQLTTETLHGYMFLESDVLSLCRRLILYPSGDEKEGRRSRVPILAISEANPLKVGWEINATVRFFVFDQIRDEYLVKEGKFVPQIFQRKSDLHLW